MFAQHGRFFFEILLLPCVTLLLPVVTFHFEQICAIIVLKQIGPDELLTNKIYITRGMMLMDNSKLCLSAADVSEQTGLSISLIRKLTRSGEIPHLRIGRRIIYPAEALAEWLAQNTVGGKAPDKDGEANG